MSVVTRKGSPYYYAAFQIKDRRFYRSTKRSNKREAEIEERRLKVEARAQIEKEEAKRPGAPLTLDEAFGKYWKDKDTKRLSHTWRSEIWRYIAHIIGLVEDKDILIENVTEAEVDQYVQEHVSLGGGEYALNRSLSVWRRTHNLCRKRWKQSTHEIEWSEFMNDEAKRVRHIRPPQASRLIEVSPDRLAEMVEWSFLTGCRRSETFNLTRDNVFLEEGRAVVIAKGGRQHTVWLTPDAIALLQRIPHRGRYVFDKTNWSKDWTAARQRAGLKDFRWHDMRHSHATWLRQAGAPLEVVQRSLGHADIAMTTRYAHVEDSELREALQLLPSLTHITTNVVQIPSFKTRG